VLYEREDRCKHRYANASADKRRLQYFAAREHVPSNVRGHARAREIVSQGATLLARRGGARC
jgi:hypothetical protein